MSLATCPRIRAGAKRSASQDLEAPSKFVKLRAYFAETAHSNRNLLLLFVDDIDSRSVSGDVLGSRSPERG